MLTPEWTYAGAPDGRTVIVSNLRTGRSYPLDPCFALRKHSPTGFAWGYGGSGPAQLALALAVHALAHTPAYTEARAAQLALAVYQDLKWRTVATLSAGDTWELTQARVLAEIRAIAVELRLAHHPLP